MKGSYILPVCLNLLCLENKLLFRNVVFNDINDNCSFVNQRTLFSSMTLDICLLIGLMGQIKI